MPALADSQLAFQSLSSSPVFTLAAARTVLPLALKWKSVLSSAHSNGCSPIPSGAAPLPIYDGELDEDGARTDPFCARKQAFCVPGELQAFLEHELGVKPRCESH